MYQWQEGGHISLLPDADNVAAAAPRLAHGETLALDKATTDVTAVNGYVNERND